VIFSILVQGLTMKPLLWILGVTEEKPVTEMEAR
jgi:hypothetical protein